MEVGSVVQVGQHEADADDRVDGVAEPEGPDVADPDVEPGAMLAGELDHAGLDVNASALESGGQLRQVESGAAAEVEQRPRVGRAVDVDQLGAQRGGGVLGAGLELLVEIGMPVELTGRFQVHRWFLRTAIRLANPTSRAMVS